MTLLGRLLILAALLASPALAHAATVVAVMEFANTSGDARWDPLGKGFQEMFLVDLAKASAIRIVPRTQLRERSEGLGITPPGAPEQRRQLAREAGADYLLSGGFRVAGEQMRLEVELLEAASGRVVLSEARDGASEVFFDLQKQALQASLTALELALTPRERAEAGRLHTADFLAFQDFSQGLDYFDAERYEAGLRSLREATERDAGFSLARLTLKAYEELVANIRQKAASLAIVRAEQERMERLASAGDAVEVVRRLLDVASDGSAANQRARLTALYLLSRAYRGDWYREEALRNYYAVEDRFAMRRASEQLAMRYHQEAVALWPALPVRIDDAFVRGFPAAETFDADFAEAQAYLWDRGKDRANNRKGYLLDNLRYPRELAEQLRLTLADEVARFDAHRELALQLDAESWRLENEQEEMVKEYRRVLRFDDSTRILEAFAAASENEHALRGFAREIERNRAFRALLAKAKDRARMEEWIRQGLEDLGSHGPVLRLGEEHFAGRGALGPEAASLLTRVRDWPRNHVLYVDDVPVWIQQPPFFFHPGPMSDPRRTASVRYHRSSDDELDGLLVMGAEPRGDVDVGVTVDYRVPDDFWPGSAEERRLAGGRPAVAVLVGLVDVDVPLARDPVTGDDVLRRPMRGVAVWVRDGQLQIATTREAERGAYDRKLAFDEDVLARKRLPEASEADRYRLDVAVRGREVVAKVGRRSVRAKLPEPPRGYAGLQLRGRGFVELRELAVR